MPLLRVPGVWSHDDNGIEFGATYDIAQVVMAMKARLPGQTYEGGPAPSELEKYYARVNRCKSCIAQGLAFCDNDPTLEILATEKYRDEAIEESVTCQPKTVERMQDCKDL